MNSSKTIGIIGGGQLGQMMAISAIYMGHKVISLDPAADCPASRVSEIIVAPYNDVDALRLLSVEDQAIATALADFAEEQGKIAEESTNELI